MSDSSAFSPEREVISSNKPPIKFKIPDNYLTPSGQITPEALSFSGKKLERIKSFSNTKEPFTDNDPKSPKVYLIVKDNDPNSPIYQQFLSQIDFDIKMIDDPDYQKCVVVLDSLIATNSSQIVGTIRPSYGFSLEDFSQKAKNNPPPKHQIDQFVQNYQSLIQKTGLPHGDWDNNLSSVRVDQFGNFKFIDYNGRGGSIDRNGQTISPSDSFKYKNACNEDPELLKIKLYQFFNISQSGKAA